MLEVILAVLLCALGFFLYLTDRNNHEIFCLKQALRDKELEIETLRSKLAAFQKSPKKKRFVSVIFRKDDTKAYDYFVGNNDVQVGDFVEVYIKDKNHGKPKQTTAEVVYLSEPGEESKHAKSAIKRKSNRNKW
ncbi:MAG: hypothetical protein IKE46_04485 [Selenomonadaceae bacterium]|nr:hypothetical protein [Selenomonadaceae bacterium]